MPFEQQSNNIMHTPIRDGSPGDIGRIDGSPFTSYEAANLFLSMTGYHGYYQVAPVTDGYVLRKCKEDSCAV